MEAGFLNGRSELLFTQARLIVMVAIVLAACSLLVNLLINKTHLESSHMTQTAYECHLVAISYNAALLGALVIYLGVIWRCEHMVSASILELSFVAVCMFAMTGVVIYPFYQAKFRGYRASDVFGDKYFSDSRLLLQIDGIITAAHLCAPLRWVSLFPLEVFAVMLYAAIVFVVGSSETMESNLHCLLFLTCLVITTALGKRASERKERQALMDLIREKRLRCEAEFRLSKAETSTSRTNRVDLGSESQLESQLESRSDSMAPTTLSGHVFEPLCENRAAVVRHLSRIAEMGDAEHWRVKGEEVRVIPNKVLGVGAFGVVAKGIFCGMLVAVKRPRQKLNEASLHNIPQLCNELRVLRYLRHPNIVATHGAIVEPAEHQIALVLEVVEGETLTEFMGRAEQVKRSSVLPRFQVMVGVCRALLYMHTRCPHIVHGDLKSGNIMIQILGQTTHPKLLDFGLSRVITRKSRRLGGTLAWVAPEVVLGRAVKCSADVYSFGRVLAFLATGSSPQDQLDPLSLRRALKQGRPPLPSWPTGCVFEPSCKTIVQSCLMADEERRPNIQQVYERLLELPQQLCLVDVYGNFLSQLKDVAAYGDQRSQEVSQVWSTTSVPLGEHQESLFEAGSEDEESSSSRTRAGADQQQAIGARVELPPMGLARSTSTTFSVSGSTGAPPTAQPGSWPSTSPRAIMQL